VVFLYEVLGDNEKALASALGRASALTLALALALAFSPNRRTHVNGAVGTAKSGCYAQQFPALAFDIPALQESVRISFPLSLTSTHVLGSLHHLAPWFKVTTAGFATSNDRRPRASVGACKRASYLIALTTGPELWLSHAFAPTSI